MDQFVEALSGLPNIAWNLLVLCGETTPFGWDHIPILHYDNPTILPPQKFMYDKIFANFFGESAIQAYIKGLVNRAVPIRRNELVAHIRQFHLFAIAAVSRYYEGEHQPPVTQGIRPELWEGIRRTITQTQAVNDLLKKLESEHPNGAAIIEAFYRSHQTVTTQLDLINQYNKRIDITKKNKIFVFLSFPEEYVKQIERLIYPDWYTACFMSEAHNSAVWAAYGNGHTGACLKFKVGKGNSNPVLRLNRMNGFSGSGPSYGDVEHPFFQVAYGTRPIPIDFFRSLSMPIPMLKAWYSSEIGGRSVCADLVFDSPDEWRNQYWKNFQGVATSKLAAWKHEKECRLILHGSGLLDFSEKKDRKAKFSFGDLDGIIFGIRTPVEQQLEVFRIIEQKCKRSGRTDFKFYQAFFSPEKGTIEHLDMGLLKFGV